MTDARVAAPEGPARARRGRDTRARAWGSGVDDGATSEGAARVTRSHLASPARLPRRFTRRSTCFRVSFLGVRVGQNHF